MNAGGVLNTCKSSEGLLSIEYSKSRMFNSEQNQAADG